LKCHNYQQLSHKARSMLLELGRQYKGSNNGDLSATWNQLKVRGWRSKGTITAALVELEYFGFIIKSRQGGRKRCNLYAITWKAIDECKGKIDILATNIAPAYWKDNKSIRVATGNLRIVG
jgi:DNA-binding MarR family transcriptional regulator